MHLFSYCSTSPIYPLYQAVHFRPRLTLHLSHTYKSYATPPLLQALLLGYRQGLDKPLLFRLLFSLYLSPYYFTPFHLVLLPIVCPTNREELKTAYLSRFLCNSYFPTVFLSIELYMCKKKHIYFYFFYCLYNIYIIFR